MLTFQACLATWCLALGWLLEVEGFGSQRTGPGAEETKSSSLNEMHKYQGPAPDISSCEQYISQGHCQFYACLDDQLDCAGAKHKKILMHKFCNRAKHHSEAFTSEGISWARDTNKCVMKKLVTEYKQPSQKFTWCNHVDVLAKEAFVECAATEGLCTALGTDRSALAKVFTAGSWMTLVEAAKSCPPTQVNQFIFWNLDNMHLQR